jgi:hypothetical protein
MTKSEGVSGTGEWPAEYKLLLLSAFFGRGFSSCRKER